MTGAAAWALGFLALMFAPTALAQTVATQPPFGLSFDLPEHVATGAALEWTQERRLENGDLRLRFEAAEQITIDLTAFRTGEETDPALYAEDARQSLLAQGAEITDFTQGDDWFELVASGVDALGLRVYGRLIKDCDGFDLMTVIQLQVASGHPSFVEEWQSITRSLTPCEAHKS